MKKIIETLKNIWRIEDLRTRLLITLLFVAIYRFGSFVVLPGIDPSRLEQLQSQTSEGLMSLLNMFSGGAFSHASIFALGIMPYISASIVVQLLAVVVPYFQKMQREEDQPDHSLPHSSHSSVPSSDVYDKSESPGWWHGCLHRRF